MERIKTLSRAALKIAVCIWIAGCGSPATDVGNPTIPLISQLVGTYGAPSTGASGTDSPATDMPQASATPACQYDATQERQITAGSGADEVVLVNFLSYSDSAKTLTATYSTGVLSATLVDDTISVVCTGTVTLDSGGLVSVSLTCDLDSPVDQTCGATLDKE